MPPVEQNTIPTSEVSRQSFADLKLVEKAMDIPVVSDTFSELEKVKNSLSENSRVQTVNHMVGVGMHLVEEGIQKLKDNEKVHSLVENETICKSVSSVKDAVLPKVTGALDKLDHLACDGIDSLTSAIPALNSSTPELYLSTKDAAKGYFLWATEYAASFTASQISLALADTSLSVAEKVTSFLKPQEQNEGLASATYTRIRGVRRSLRAVKRAGARLNPPAHKSNTFGESSLFGRIASMYYVNALLGALGVQLVPGVEEKTRELLDDSYSHLEDLKGDLDGYKSEEDPDYETESDEDSIDGSEDEAEEDSSEDEEEEENDVSEQEARQEKHIKDEVVDETCGLGDQCCKEGTCEMGAHV